METEFNLGEEMDKLRQKMRETGFKENEISYVLVEVLLMNKEAVRLLKEELIALCGNRDLEYGEHHLLCEYCIDESNVIDKIFGPKLTGEENGSN